MKRWLPFCVIVLAGLAAIFVAERSKVNSHPDPSALLLVTSDAQRELSRIPAHLDRLSDEDEERVGDRLAAEYSEHWQPKPEDAEATKQIEAYIQQVGAGVAAHAKRKLPYRFHYIPDSGFVNAFALPGGHVFVGEGLLKLMRSEDALAAVLGHEVEHVDLRHCAERVQQEGTLRHAGVLGDLLALPVTVFTAGYSRQQELEADRAGLTLALNAGYSPKGILQLLDAFIRLEHEDDQKIGGHPSKPGTPADEAARLSVQTLEDYFQSHPPSEQRKQILEQMTAGRSAPPLRPLACQGLLSPPDKMV